MMHTVLSEVQLRLSELAACWRAAGGDAKRLNCDASVSVVASRLLVGAASDAEAEAVLIFGGRTSVVYGDTRYCSRGDIWVLFPPGHEEPLLLRALWRGVTPKGRMQCRAVSHATKSWLGAQAAAGAKMLSMFALVVSGFAAELSQLDALVSWASESDDAARGAEVAQLLGVGALPAAPAASPGSGAAQPAWPAEIADEASALNVEQVAVLRGVSDWALHGERCSAPVLIRGVFGSGKSRTLAASVVLLDRLLRQRKDPRRIMLLCQTNAAVDAVLHTLLGRHRWDDFARLGSFKSVDPALLYRTVSLMATRPAAAAELSEALARRPPEVGEQLRAAVDSGVLPPRATVWRRRRLVAATTTAIDAADHFGAELLHCGFVFVDEATQLTEPAIFSVLQRVAAQRLLVLGDPRQLPPRVSYTPLQRSLLERLWDERPGSTRIEMAAQYRCHPAIAELGSALFYGGFLRSGISAESRASVLGPEVPPLLVLLSSGSESRFGKSYRHESEALQCVEWIGQASRRSGLAPSSFGVICFYRPQSESCAKAAAACGLQGVQASTVDAFQGAEREVIVLSCGRSTSTSIGSDRFCACPRRLNVALSRARRHLVIFGGEAFLEQHPILGHILAVARQRGCVRLAAAAFQVGRS